MAKHRASGDEQSTRQGVIEPPGADYWSVDDSRWPTVRPDLPAHLVDLLAPPIVVGVARVPVTSRLTPPAVVDPLPSPADAVPADVPALVPSGAAPAEPAPPPPAPPRPVPTPPLNPRPVPTPPPDRPVPGPPTSPRRSVNTGPIGSGRRGNGGPVSAGRHRRGTSDRAG
ncbi:hypothetical protein KBX53_21935 [Micromonospora sp. M51]|uniref:Uncharacterized protein n=1 Tax=Micromonospora parva TaxID=1464048 RepID=A0ABW6VW16_9ACTN|nr:MULTISPECIES: hypothetical protein [Micromonospora]MBQ1013557.1 hypothetical protein [Micromonospora sp. M51]MBQ1032107.1 hypothetical protein [Micromonospora sp. C97]